MRESASSKFFIAISVLFFAGVLTQASGCGSGSDTTVIEPGVGYELTAEEKAQNEIEDKMRGGED